MFKLSMRFPQAKFKIIIALKIQLKNLERALERLVTVIGLCPNCATFELL